MDGGRSINVPSARERRNSVRPTPASSIREISLVADSRLAAVRVPHGRGRTAALSRCVSSTLSVTRIYDLNAANGTPCRLFIGSDPIECQASRHENHCLIRAVLDADVLYQLPLRDTMLLAAIEGCFKPLWTDQILKEAVRNMLADGQMNTAAANRKLAALAANFEE